MNTYLKGELYASVKIASAYLGSLIGAGFASGQEVMSYFAAYNEWGMLGIVVCAAAIFIMIACLCRLIRLSGADGFRPLLKIACGETLGKIFSAVFLMFTFVVFGVMASGFSASVNQHFGTDSHLGGIIFLMIMALVLLCGERGVVIVNMALIPVMVIAVLVVCSILISRGMPVSALEGTSAAASALLYAGYNGIIGIAVVAELSNLIRGRLCGIFAAALSSGLFMLLMTPLYTLMLQSRAELSSHSVPMLHAASSIGPMAGHLYFAVLLMAMITTGAGCGFTLCGALKLPIKRGSFILPLCAVPFLFLDFAGLVARLYAAFGVAGTALLFLITVRAALLYPKKRHAA